MAGVGKVPKQADERRSRHVPQRGEWQPTEASGWQYGPVPKPPSKLLKPSRETWAIWFGAWYAAHWRPEVVPQVVITIRLYDAVARGELQRAAELRLAMDAIGVTMKGWQDRRWSPPKDEAPAEDEPAQPETPDGSRYGHLRSVPA